MRATGAVHMRSALPPRPRRSGVHAGPGGARPTHAPPLDCGRRRGRPAASAAGGGGGGRAGGGRGPPASFPALLRTLATGPHDLSRLSPAGQAAAVTAAYILTAGAAAAAAPLPVFRLLFPVGALPHPAWLRLVGCLAATFGVYYAGAALGETSGLGAGAGFYAATAVGRLALAAALAALAWSVRSAGLGTGLAVFAALNAAGGLAMAAALGKGTV